MQTVLYVPNSIEKLVHIRTSISESSPIAVTIPLNVLTHTMYVGLAFDIEPVLASFVHSVYLWQDENTFPICDLAGLCSLRSVCLSWLEAIK